MDLSKLYLPVLAIAAFCTSVNAATIFNFDNDSLGTATGFTDTVGGVSATFSSAGDPAGFVVYPSVFETLTGNVLGDPGPNFSQDLALTIGFNQTLSAVTLNFATSEFATTSPLILNAYENGVLVGSASSTPTFLQGFTFPEGEIAFSGLFNSLVLSTNAPDFAVDNINVIPSTTAVPEPSAAALSFAGLSMIGSGYLLRAVSARLNRTR